MKDTLLDKMFMLTVKRMSVRHGV